MSQIEEYDNELIETAPATDLDNKTGVEGLEFEEEVTVTKITT